MSGTTTSETEPPADPCRIAASLAARAAGVALDEVLHPTRCSRDSASARALAMYLAHVGLGLTMGRVAAGFARHRSTVAHACRRVEERRESARWDRRIAALEEEMRGLVHGRTRRGGSEGVRHGA